MGIWANSGEEVSEIAALTCGPIFAPFVWWRGPRQGAGYGFKVFRIPPANPSVFAPLLHPIFLQTARPLSTQVNVSDFFNGVGEFYSYRGSLTVRWGKTAPPGTSESTSFQTNCFFFPQTKLAPVQPAPSTGFNTCKMGESQKCQSLPSYGYFTVDSNPLGIFDVFPHLCSTPGCNEIVTWVVMKDTKSITLDTLNKFKNATIDPAASARKFSTMATATTYATFGNYLPPIFSRKLVHSVQYTV